MTCHRNEVSMNHRHDEVILYTRQGCQLCAEADELLRGYGLAPQQVDVDSDPQLAAKFTECVPVVVINGRLRFRGRVNEVLLQRQLAGRVRR